MTTGHLLVTAHDLSIVPLPFHTVDRDGDPCTVYDFTERPATYQRHAATGQVYLTFSSLSDVERSRTAAIDDWYPAGLVQLRVMSEQQWMAATQGPTAQEPTKGPRS